MVNNMRSKLLKRRGYGRPALAAGRLVFAFLVGAAALLFVASPPAAWAHGEESQQAFERTSTVVFYDINYSTERLDIGQELTITGTLRVMNSWPDHTVAPPDLGYLTVNQPGPVFEVQAREMSGTFTPESVKVVKGGVYPFKIVLKARVPGTWHIHPAMAMHGTGTLAGAGRYITINNAGVFTEPQTLADGRTVNLNTYGLTRVIVWEVLGLLVAVAFAAYWLRKSLLQRAAVVYAGEAASLCTKRERKVSIIIAVVALALGFGGYAYAYAADGPHVPLQVVRIAPPPEAPSALGTHLQTTVQSAVFQSKAATVQLKVNVKNNSNSPVVLDHLQFADYQIAVKDNADPTEAGVASISPAGAIAPGNSTDVTVTFSAKALHDRNLLQLNEAQVRMTGLLFFRDTAGQTSVAEINELTTGVIPQYT